MLRVSLLLTAVVQVVAGLHHGVPAGLIFGTVLLGVGIGYGLAPAFRRNVLLLPMCCMILLGLSLVTFTLYQPGLELANLAGGVALLWIDLDENWPRWRKRLANGLPKMSRLLSLRRPVAGQ